MHLPVIALAIGLLCSFGAYIYSVRGFLGSFKLLVEEKQDAITKERESVLHKIAASTKDTFVSLMIATLLLYLCLVGAGIFVGATTKTNQDALCALRGDLELRTESGKEFLKEHPKGIPGVPVSTILKGIHDEERSIKALDGLSC